MESKTTQTIPYTRPLGNEQMLTIRKGGKNPKGGGEIPRKGGKKRGGRKGGGEPTSG